MDKMNYKEAITHIETIDKNAEFLAIAYDESDHHFYIYLLTDRNDKRGVDIVCHLTGGIPFHSDGVEDCLEIEEAISLIEHLHFKLFDDYPKISGLVAEHILYELFPALPDPETIWNQPEQLNFIKLAKNFVKLEAP